MSSFYPCSEEKREAKDVQAVTMKYGKPAQQGICPVCGTKMFRIGAPKNTELEYDAAKVSSTAKSKSAAKIKSATNTK
jgi:hypothetical protein